MDEKCRHGQALILRPDNPDVVACVLCGAQFVAEDKLDAMTYDLKQVQSAYDVGMRTHEAEKIALRSRLHQIQSLCEQAGDTDELFWRIRAIFQVENVVEMGVTYKDNGDAVLAERVVENRCATDAEPKPGALGGSAESLRGVEKTRYRTVREVSG